MKKNSAIALLLAVVVVFSVTTVGFADARSLDVKQELNINLYQEPYNLDFQLTSSSGDIQIYNWIMEGLTRCTDGGKVKPGIAKSWEVSKDGKTWTFHLRDASWTDGKKVTAMDFAYGWLRALEPDMASDYAYILYDIVGAEEFNTGKGPASNVGIRAIDDKTLEVRLKNPVSYFDYLVSMPTCAPCREDLVDKYGEDYNTEAAYFVTDGPFTLQVWLHGIAMVFAKNPSYWDAGSIKLQRINGYMVYDDTSELNMYKEGELDLTVALSGQQPKELDKSEIKSYIDGSVWYLNYNCKDSIMKNKNIRKALTLAIDRSSFLKEIGKPEWKPALALVQPEVIFDADGKTFREKKPSFFKDNDVKTAKTLLAQGMKELKLKKLPVLKLLTNDTSSTMYYGEVLQDMWKKSLGIDVQLEPVSSAERIQRQHEHDFQISLAGWGPDYPDAMTDLDLFVTGGGNNDSAYSNPKYDALIKAAKAEVDKKKRSELLHSAEQLLMDDMPIGPLYYRYRNYAIHDYVKGLTRNAIGADIDFVYAYIEGK